MTDHKSFRNCFIYKRERRKDIAESMLRRQNLEQDANQGILTLRQRIAELDAEAARTKSLPTEKPNAETKDTNTVGIRQ